MGIPPTGNRVNFTGISIYRIEGGKIAESWSVSDLLGMMQQLGAIGELGPAQGA
jgi:predicted ester cyclase